MEKRDFFNKYKYETYAIDNNAKDDSIYKSKKSDLLSMIPTGKLYKYVSLEDKYAILNILNEVLHFSDPISFNDPFDAVLGISTDEVTSEYMIKYTKDKFSQNIQESIDKKIVICILNAFIEKRIDVKDFKYFSLLECKNINEKNYEKTKKDVLNEAFRILNNIGLNLNRKNRKVIKDKLKAEILINIILPINSYEYPYDCFLSICRILGYGGNGINFYEDTKKKIECDILKENKKITSNYIRTTCMSTDYKNILMWSHYGNKHNGICMEYDISDWNKDLILNLLPVIYNDERISFDRQCINKINDDFTFEYNKNKITENILLSLFCKSTLWKYEDEWRIMMPKEMLDNNNYKMPKISKVYFGVNVSDEEYKNIKKILKKFDPTIECSMLKMKGNKFELI